MAILLLLYVPFIAIDFAASDFYLICSVVLYKRFHIFVLLQAAATETCFVFFFICSFLEVDFVYVLNNSTSFRGHLLLGSIRNINYFFSLQEKTLQDK